MEGHVYVINFLKYLFLTNDGGVSRFDSSYIYKYVRIYGVGFQYIPYIMAINLDPSTTTQGEIIEWKDYCKKILCLD